MNEDPDSPWAVNSLAPAAPTPPPSNSFGGTNGYAPGSGDISNAFPSRSAATMPTPATSTPTNSAPTSPGSDYTWNATIGAFLYTPGGRAEEGSLERSPYSTTNNGYGQTIKQGLPFNAYTDASVNNARDNYVAANPNISATDMYALTRASQALTQAVSTGQMSREQAVQTINTLAQSVTPKPPAQAAPVLGSPSNANKPGSAVSGPGTAIASGRGQTAPSLGLSGDFDGMPYASGKNMPTPGTSPQVAYDIINNRTGEVIATFATAEEAQAWWQQSANYRPNLAAPGVSMGQEYTLRTRTGMITPPNTGEAGLAANGNVRYTVDSGDTLGAIAARYGTTVEAIAAANGIANPNLIVVGQSLEIPVGGAGLPTPGYTNSGPVAGPGAPVGPNGRSVQQITGTDYLSPEERDWYLAQRNLSVPSAGGVPTPAVGGPVNTGGGGYWGDWGELPGQQMAGWATSLGYTPQQIIYGGQSQFSPAVEQWRPLVEQYFAPEDVNHALWIMQRESGGQNIPQIGGGPGTGLFQVESDAQHPGRPTQQQLLDPAFNVQYAANMVYGRR